MCRCQRCPRLTSTLPCCCLPAACLRRAGIVGITAAALGAHVMLTDTRDILPQIMENVTTNEGIISAAGGSATVSELDWNDPDDEVGSGGGMQWQRQRQRRGRVRVLLHAGGAAQRCGCCSADRQQQTSSGCRVALAMRQQQTSRCCCPCCLHAPIATPKHIPHCCRLLPPTRCWTRTTTGSLAPTSRTARTRCPASRSCCGSWC